MASRHTWGVLLLAGLLLCTHALVPASAQETPAAAATPAEEHDHEHDHATEVAAAGGAVQGAAANQAADADHAAEGAEGEHAHEEEAAAEEHAHEEGEELAEEEADLAAAADADLLEEEHADHPEGEHADHAEDAAGDAHAHDEDAAHDHSGHAHGVSIMEFAAVAAELGSVDAAKEDVCSMEASEDYNLGLHIGSVFILLGVSAGGALLPVVLHISSKSGSVMAVIKMGTFFGFGTILSTAFIHMLLPAAQNLSSPCLPESWNDAYEAWAYLFVTISIVFMQLIDFLIEGAYQKYIERRGGQPHVEACHEQAHDHDKHTHHAAVVGALVSMHSSKAQLHGNMPSASEPPSDVEAGQTESSELGEDGDTCAVHGKGCNTLIKHKHDPSQIVGIYLLEAGIIFHSVLIGITLGVTGGSAFNTLLVALSFHQFFEGFAIGSAVVDSGMTALRSMLMGLAYAVTTPIGIAIGIGMRESFNKNSTTTLMVEGIFDSISTGILIYVVLVELINPLMTQSAWLRSRRWWVQAMGFVSFWGGVTVMAVIGKWV
ncbi:hypothetical protein CHLNCDRAFT_58029 [Chlorella variabilis]|uniref:Uncharacterized protein n=1 Tax=Chlorella variabilis TaxID=554065 RepID=E1ZGF4_CHLVA|nr:hypothetical protein CHLNCDRAFT_58029 [Chlorella variabilis]EFN54748.1 hypothetical protein CHLNCDRAFT_58029 [Chlorella variabilis]|eukprot:XP_005846850.1 hypothetical protein CHLNCDRAFT_58029 [Chlorella variabilis]